MSRSGVQRFRFALLRFGVQVFKSKQRRQTLGFRIGRHKVWGVRF